jgi:lysosomal acid lipase/cholesteryl ester hydrolase
MDCSTAQCPGFYTKNSISTSNFRKKSFPFVLAEEGYDVWVGNNRGTVYSDTNNQMPRYWEFNVDHFAQHDQPALINKVL